MTLPQHGLLVTGLYWKGRDSELTLAGPDGTESALPIRPGQTLAWRLRGPRQCTGIWHPRRSNRLMCPTRTSIPANATSSQCPQCSMADPSGALARDKALDDPRSFAVYLALFGRDLTKIGITAAERGLTRLTEQAAITFTWLGHGPLLAARRAETTAKTTAQISDRLTAEAKTAAWWELPDAGERAEILADVQATLTAQPSWGEGLNPAPFEVHDLADIYGLNRPLPSTDQQIAEFTNGLNLRADLLCLAGRSALLKVGYALTVQADLRLLAGWIIADPPPGEAGVLSTRPRPARTRPSPGGTHEQPEDVLF